MTPNDTADLPVDTKATRRWRFALCLVAALMGAAGVALAAAGSHRGGGEDVRIASEFLLIHATVVIGVAALAASTSRPRAWLVAASVLELGSILFSGDLAMIGLASLRPFPLAAPVGGFGMILGWLLIAYAAAAAIVIRN